MSFPTGIRQDLGSVLRERAAERGERTFAISASERRSWTYGEFDSQVNSVASGLRDMGVQAGDFVNLFMRNSVERLVASYAVMKLGAVDVAINAEARGKSLERMLNLAASRVLIVTQRCDRSSKNWGKQQLLTLIKSSTAASSRTRNAETSCSVTSWLVPIAIRA